MVTRKKKHESSKDQKSHSRKGFKVGLYVNFLLGAIWFSLLIFTLVEDPIILALKEYTRVRNGSFVHQFMLKETEGLHVRVFLFNMSNAREFAEGRARALALQEVGPFTYREMRSNVDVVIDEQRARMQYTPRVRIEFVPGESVGRPEDVAVTMPNIPMLGQATKLSDSGLVPHLAFNLLASRLQSGPTVTLDAASYLWGYQEPLISLSHHLLPDSVPFDKMGILDRIYDSKKRNRIEVSIADEDKYTLKSINGYKKLAMKENEDPKMCSLCNTLEDTYEGIGYRPEVDSSYRIRLFRIGLCRTFDLEYSGTKNMDYGSAAMIYRFKDNFFTLDPNATSTGVLALPDCFLGVSLAFSKPHLQDVDPRVYERIEGIRPDPARFPAWIAVDPKVGLQLETVISLQLNLVIGDVSFNAQANNFSNMVLPIAFLQIEQPPLPEESKMFLSGVYRKGPWLLLAARGGLLVLLLVHWGLVARTLYRNHTQPDDTAICQIKETSANIIVHNDSSGKKSQIDMRER